jgi:energy-converting hydrogenase Eha subunit H
MTAYVFTSTSGTLGSVLAVLLVLLAASIPAWAIGHAVGTSRKIFELQGRSKAKWVAWMSVLFLAGDVGGLVVAIWYLTKVRPGLNRTRVTY